jgi:hypothetical protein
LPFTGSELFFTPTISVFRHPHFPASRTPATSTPVIANVVKRPRRKQRWFEIFLDCRATFGRSQGREERCVRDWIASALCASQGRVREFCARLGCRASSRMLAVTDGGV